MNKLLSIILLLTLYSCSVAVQRQYEPYYTSKGKLIAKENKKVKELRLPRFIENEILPSYMHNNLNNLTDTSGVDETFGIFMFRILPSGDVESVEMIEGVIPQHAVYNLIAQFYTMNFEESKKTTKWYLPLQLEIPRGKEISPHGGIIYEGKVGYLTWTCFNPKDKGVRRGFKAYR